MQYTPSRVYIFCIHSVPRSAMVPQFSRRSLTILHQDLVHVRVVALETALRWNEALFGTVTVSSDHDLLEHIHGIHGKPRVHCFFNVQYPTCFSLSMRNGIRNVFFDGQNPMETTSVQYVILLKNNNEYSIWKPKNCVHTFPVVSKSSSQKYQKNMFHTVLPQVFPSFPIFSHLFPWTSTAEPRSWPWCFSRPWTRASINAWAPREEEPAMASLNIAIYIYTYSNSIDGNNNIDGITIYSNWWNIVQFYSNICSNSI